MQRHKLVKVKTAKGRKISSINWLLRQLNDPYTIKAKKEGYASRAAYKLLEIDSKFKLLGKNKIIIDLGAAPGSWTQVALRKASPKKVIAVDLQELNPAIYLTQIQGMSYDERQVVEFIKGDFTQIETLKKIACFLETKADLILSDMAPNTSGHKDLDHLKIIDLGEHALEFATKTLAKGGSLVIKTFQGGGEKLLADKLKKSFAQVKFFKPQSSRKDSSEIFLIAFGIL